jgi:small-conductance mechanosensitive channel
MYQVGDNIEVKDIKGTLASIGSVASKVMGENESITTVPNTFLLANKVTKQ